MYYIIHIATVFQSFKAQRREIQELIWEKTQHDRRIRELNHPILSATLDQYLAKETPEIVAVSSALKTKMALTPEFGQVIGVARALVNNGQSPRMKVDISQTPQGEKDLLQEFWKKLGRFIHNHGTPTFVTWNGREFTFPFLIERSTALGVETSCVLPRARFQPWKHLDLLAELADYDPHRYMGLKSRLALWGLKLNGNGEETHLKDPETLIRQWQNGLAKPLEENLILTLDAIHQILTRVAPYLLEAKYNGNGNT